MGIGLHTAPVSKRRDVYILTAIALMTLAVFSPVLWHGFIDFDDPGIVTLNPAIQAGLTLDGIRWAFTSGYMANWMPLTWVSHMLDVQLFGMNPAGHHAVNILLHAFSSSLLFLFLNQSTSAPWRSAAVAVLFALHPLHVESVAWVAERKDVLSAFFWMLTMYTYLRYAERPGTVRYVLTLVPFALGLMAKPMLVTLPALLLLLDWWPLKRFPETQNSAIRLIVEKIPFFLLSACSSIITYLVHRSSGEVFQGYTLWARVSRACVSYVVYLQKMVWPTELAIIYPFSLYPPSMLKILLSACVLLLVTCAVLWLRRDFPFLAVGWGWYLITLLPVIGLIQIGQHSVADRYTYIPLIGMFMLVVWGIRHLMEKWRSGGAVLGALSAVLLVLLITMTSLQLRHWKNTFTIFSHAIEVTEGNWVAHNNLGMAHMAEGRLPEAITHFKRSIVAKPSYVIALINLGVALYKSGDSQSAATAFTSALMLEPGNPEAHFGLGVLYVESGEMARALEEYRRLQASGSHLAVTLMDLIRPDQTRHDSPVQ